MWIGVRSVEKNRRHFFEQHFAHINGAMNAVAEAPTNRLAGSNRLPVSLSAVPVLDVEQVAAQDDRHSMARIAVPRRGFSRGLSEGAEPGNSLGDAGPADLPSCTVLSSVFCFFSLMQLLRQKILDTHLVDCVQLAFEIVHVVFFVFQYFFK